MCEDCFPKPIYQFNTYLEFDKFDIELTGKIAQGKLNFKEKPEVHLAPSYYYTASYECKSCNELWVLSEPEQAWRGYFLPKSLAEDYISKISRNEGKGRYGCLFILVIVILIIAYNLIS